MTEEPPSMAIPLATLAAVTVIIACAVKVTQVAADRNVNKEGKSK